MKKIVSCLFVVVFMSATLPAETEYMKKEIGPHKGVIVPPDRKKKSTFFIEVLRDYKKGTVSVYLLQTDKKKPLPLSKSPGKIRLRITNEISYNSKTLKSYELVLKGKKEKNCFRYDGSNELLKNPVYMFFSIDSHSKKFYERDYSLQGLIESITLRKHGDPNKAMAWDPEYGKYRDKDENTLLHLAVKNKFIPPSFLKSKYIPINAKNKEGDTALHIALQTTIAGNSAKLIAEGADPTIQDKDGNTALHIIVKTQDDFLLKRIPKKQLSITTKNNAGETLLDLTKKYNNKRHYFIKILKENGAKYSDEL